MHAAWHMARQEQVRHTPCKASWSQGLMESPMHFVASHLECLSKFLRFVFPVLCAIPLFL